MAVQAQYPSNIFLLDRGVQDGKNPLANNYSLQPQPGGGVGFLDQSQLFDNTNEVESNPRKRGRDHITTTTMTTATGNGAVVATWTTPLIVNQLMCMQSQQPPQLIDLTQLHNSQSNVVSTGLRLAFGDQPQQSQQQILPAQSSFNPFPLLSEDLASKMKQQIDEMDQFLHEQGEQLKRTLAEKRQRYYRTLLGTVEESVLKRLREKEAELERAAQRNAEMEARASQLGAEAQAWRARARAQEAAAFTLRVDLERALMGGVSAAAAPHLQQQQPDIGGKCGGRVGCATTAAEAEDAESAYIDPYRVVVWTGPSCKACRKRVATMVVLPCRHLCLCSECDAMAQACPLCFTYRRSSVEALLC